MSLMDDFTAVREALQRHLPRAATGSLVTLDEDGLRVAEPGVSLADLSHLIDDITGGALYLASSLSGFVTGQTIIIDGGKQFI